MSRIAEGFAQGSGLRVVGNSHGGAWRRELVQVPMDTGLGGVFLGEPPTPEASQKVMAAAGCSTCGAAGVAGGTAADTISVTVVTVFGALQTLLPSNQR